MKPVWDGKQFAPRLMLPLSLSYDHRVIDGAQGARFIAYLSNVSVRHPASGAVTVIAGRVGFIVRPVDLTAHRAD